MEQARDWLSPKQPGMRADPVLGTMNFGTRTPEPAAVQIMTRAIERGVVWFDTANAYGASEEIIGVLEEARKAGQIGAWGVSNFASWRIQEINHVCGELPRPRVSQVLYNLLIRQVEHEYFDFANHTGIHTTVYNPLAGGLLAGKGAAKVEPGGRFDGNTRYQKRYLTDRMRELSDAYAALATDAGIDRVLLAYSWLANQPGVDSVLLGPATVEHLDVGIAGCQRPIDAELQKKIDEIYAAFVGTDASYAR